MEYAYLEECKTCIHAAGELPSTASVLLKMSGILAVIVAATTYGWITCRKKIYPAGGLLAVFLVAGSYIYSIVKYGNRDYPLPVCDSIHLVRDSLKTAGTEEFFPVDSDFSAEFDDSFSADDSENAETTTPAESVQRNRIPWQTIVLLSLTALIGLAVKYPVVRNLRSFLLLSSMIYLGFVHGACPCMIMSLQQTALFAIGVPVAWTSMLWFTGLIVVTYFFGKTWCGWLCHLGALQDFLFRNPKRKRLASEKSRSAIKYVQAGLLLLLVVQLIVTRNIVWMKYDPFRVAYNLFSSNVTGYVLLVLLLVSSLLIYRPFCRIVCPVGLVLGWVTKIPGARKLKVRTTTCNGCKNCVNRCKQQAIHLYESKAVVDTEDCILCGECLAGCKRNSITLKHLRK